MPPFSRSQDRAVSRKSSRALAFVHPSWPSNLGARLAWHKTIMVCKDWACPSSNSHSVFLLADEPRHKLTVVQGMNLLIARAAFRIARFNSMMEPCGCSVPQYTARIVATIQIIATRPVSLKYSIPTGCVCRHKRH